jgi:hypothetical protein
MIHISIKDLFGIFVLGGVLVAIFIGRAETKRIIVKEELSNGTGRNHDGKSESRPEPQNLRAFPATG